MLRAAWVPLLELERRTAYAPNVRHQATRAHHGLATSRAHNDPRRHDPLPRQSARIKNWRAERSDASLKRRRRTILEMISCADMLAAPGASVCPKAMPRHTAGRVLIKINST
jgi:hypothetical protein